MTKKPKPKIELAKTYEGEGEEETTVYHIQSIIEMENTNYVSAGYENLSVTPNNGKFKVVLNVDIDLIPVFKIRTPVVHTLTLEGIELTAQNPLVEVIVMDISSTPATEVGKRVVHRDDADDDVLPGG